MEQLRNAASRERDFVREEIGEVLKRQLLVIRVRSATRGQLPPLSSALSETRRDARVLPPVADEGLARHPHALNALLVRQDM